MFTNIADQLKNTVDEIGRQVQLLEKVLKGIYNQKKIVEISSRLCFQIEKFRSRAFDDWMKNAVSGRERDSLVVKLRTVNDKLNR